MGRSRNPLAARQARRPFGAESAETDVDHAEEQVWAEELEAPMAKAKSSSSGSSESTLLASGSESSSSSDGKKKVEEPKTKKTTNTKRAEPTEEEKTTEYPSDDEKRSKSGKAVKVDDGSKACMACGDPILRG